MKFKVLVSLVAILAASRFGLAATATVVTSPAAPDAAATAVPGARLDYPPGKPPRFWSVALAESVMARWPDYTQAYFNSWTYVNGYMFCGFERLWRDTGDRRYQGIIANAKINERGLVDIASACDGVGVQTDYAHYIHYKQSFNAKEAVVGFLWAAEIVERRQLARIKK